MQPVRLEIKNFLSHAHSVLDFTKLDPVTLIMGEIEENPQRSNGAGKSTLLDGVLFALFGQCRKVGTRRGINLNRLVKDGEDRAEVTFEFIVDDVLHRIVRSRIAHEGDKGRSELLLLVENGGQWRPITGDRISETEEKITHLIGANFDTFVNTVLFPQGDISSFATMGASERKDVVRSILQLEQYDVYEEQARERAKQFDRQLEGYDAFFTQHGAIEEELNNNREQLETTKGVVANKRQQIELGEKKVDESRRKLAGLQARADRKIELQREVELSTEDVRTAVDRLHQITEKQEQYKEQAEKAHEEFERFNEEIKRKAGQRPDRQAIATTADQNKKQLERWETVVEERRQAEYAVNSRVQNLAMQIKHIDELEEGQCPTCHSAVTPDTKADALRELQNQSTEQQGILNHARQQLEEARTTLEQFKVEEETLKQRAEEFNTFIRELKLLQERSISARDRYQGTKTMLEDANAMVQTHEQTALHAQERLEKMEIELRQLDDVDENKFQQLRREIIEEGQSVKSLQEQLHDSELQIRSIGVKIQEQEVIVQEITAKRKECFDLEHKRRIYRELTAAFGKKGIQAIILENCSLEIEEIANKLLHRLTGGQVQVEIQTQRESTTGNIQEVFDILIKSDQRIAPFDLYSGGEGLRIAFAIRIALSTLLARRAGTRISTLWYDEAFAQLDGEGRNQLIEAFDILADEFDYQLVISHRNDLRTEFESVLTIKKQGTSSTIIQ